jgi:hypothetical protein
MALISLAILHEKDRCSRARAVEEMILSGAPKMWNKERTRVL